MALAMAHTGYFLGVDQREHALKHNVLTHHTNVTTVMVKRAD